MEFLAAVLAIIGSGIVAFLTARWTAERERENLREQLKLDYAVETAITHLLKTESYKKRSLKKIKHHIRGFEDNELRQHLVRAGAVAFGGEGDDEKWGLLSLNEDDMK